MILIINHQHFCFEHHFAVKTAPINWIKILPKHSNHNTPSRQKAEFDCILNAEMRLYHHSTLNKRQNNHGLSIGRSPCYRSLCTEESKVALH